MTLDVPTLLAVTVLVTGIVGGLLLLSWLQNRRIAALAWWGGAQLLGTFGGALICLRGRIPDPLSIDLGNAAVFLAYGAFWSGTRVFERRSPMPAWALVGSMVWLLALRFPFMQDSMDARVCLASVIVPVYMLLAVAELWRGRSEALISRYSLMVVLGLHTLVIGARFPLLVGGMVQGGATWLQSSWVSTLSFENLLFTIVMPFLLMALAKERIELEQGIAASRDSLTGILNRGAFFAQAQRLFDRDRREGRDTSLVLFDLDHFKTINDRHGHQAGDNALREFCRVVESRIGPRTLFGRLGGEEFGCLLPGASTIEASRVAEEVRASFAATPLGPVDQRFAGTVSAGLAVSDGDVDLDQLVGAADKALYRAKNRGRNRVERNSGGWRVLQSVA